MHMPRQLDAGLWRTQVSANSGYIRRHIATLDAYNPILPFDVLSEELGIPVEEIIKLDANENPYGTIPEVLEALGNLPYPHIYPDPQSRALRSRLASHLDLPMGNILAGAGADELIDLVIRLSLEPGDSLINCPPTFGMYGFDAQISNIKIIDVPRKDDFSLNLQAIKEASREHKPKLLFLANPNNPDGSLIPDQVMDAILELPLLVVLDEAYIEFAGKGRSRTAEVLQRNNLIVLRTFSKWAGLAGLRVGYGIFPEPLFAQTMKIKQPYNVSVAASAAAIVALDNFLRLEQIGEKIIVERERLFTKLEKFAWLKLFPSEANFILCAVLGRDAKALKDQLAQRGILVRHFDKPGLRNYLRISVGRPEHTDKLVRTLETLE